jgi:hypothetical protein
VDLESLISAIDLRPEERSYTAAMAATTSENELVTFFRLVCRSSAGWSRFTTSHFAGLSSKIKARSIMHRMYSSSSRAKIDQAIGSSGSKGCSTDPIYRMLPNYAFMIRQALLSTAFMGSMHYISRSTDSPRLGPQPGVSTQINRFNETFRSLSYRFLLGPSPSGA